MEENTVVDVMPEHKYLNICVENGDKKFTFQIPEGSKIGESYDAAFQILHALGKMANDAIENAKKAMSEPQSVEPEIVESEVVS